MDTMMQMEAPKGPCKLKSEVDNISKLHRHIIDKILSKLSLKDAVRTSILSSEWRYKWSTLPHLVFDDQSSVLVSSEDQTVLNNKFVNIVDQVLVLHDGPIIRFMISHRGLLQPVSGIDRWILYLSRRYVKEFVLDIWKGSLYTIPSSLYLCRSLIHLELYNCLLKPPVTFNGFKTLKSLDLQLMAMEQSALGNMISSCPLLERLTLRTVDGVTNLEIHAPNLLSFETEGDFESINFRNTFHLSEVSINFNANSKFKYNGVSGNLIKFFAHLPRIMSLNVHSYFLKYLAAGKVPRELPTPCLELSCLSLCIDFKDGDESLAALCLLRSCPNLKELELFARLEENFRGINDIVDVVKDNNDNCVFNHLKIVKVVDISGLIPELSFIKYILAKSLVLEKMIIKLAPAADRGWESEKKLMKELLRFERTSVRSRIIYEDP